MRFVSLLCLSLLLASCSSMPRVYNSQAEQSEKLELLPMGYAQVPGWTQDDMAGALIALKKSCAPMIKRAPETPVSATGIAGSVRDWLPACQAALTDNGTAQPRQFFETYFNPYQMNTPNGPMGLFTGYYEKILRGSLTRTAHYNVPLYKRPNDLISVDLGAFRPALKGERIAGKVVGSALQPYADRAQIENGALAGKGLELAWVDDANAAFFLHIQGSGRVMLDNGQTLRIGYDGQNGHVYNAIGKELIARGALTPETTSLQTIRAWLMAHPDQAASLRNLNPSYIFFRVLEGDGPMGAQGIALTPERSLAVDPRFIPYGVPMFVNVPHPTQPDAALQRLMIAQDTGGAIRGPIRGDFFWGAGAQAEQNAGFMKSRGTAWMLLPKSVKPKS